MNTDAIRAEAIERIARAFYESWRAVFNGMPKYEGDPPEALPYDDAPDDYKPKRANRRAAAEAVDALGDMLRQPDPEPVTSCICKRWGDTGGYQIADLTCPVHGVNGTNPGDWREAA